ncbi:MAG: glycerate kinase [Nitrospiraceae bacterium]
MHEPRIRSLLGPLLESGLSAARPAVAIERLVTRRGTSLCVGRRVYDLRAHMRVVAVGAGKASGRMAVALEHILGPRLHDGLVVVKHGHGVPTARIKLVEAGHPLPDRAGQRAAQRLLSLVKGLTPQDLLFVLLSGGASSLLAAPPPGIPLADKQRTTDLLLRSGATIQQINTVRKHLSTLKGGQLVAATRARVVGLILSDVIGDDLGTIGSGLTAPDPTTYANACKILRRFRIWNATPAKVRMHLSTGRRGQVAETPKPGAPVFRRVQNVIIGNNRLALTATSRAARDAGLRPVVMSMPMTGDARHAARVFGKMARRIVSSGKPARRPTCVIGGGELTVSVRGKGKGGRAQEFALAAAVEIKGLKNVWVVGFGTDGIDGPTDVAGAVADGGTVDRARRLGMDAVDALRRNASYHFFQKLGGHIITGPTGTNVNDLYLLIVL